jgi:hypothetical protein
MRSTVLLADDHFADFAGQGFDKTAFGFHQLGDTADIQAHETSLIPLPAVVV